MLAVIGSKSHWWLFLCGPSKGSEGFWLVLFNAVGSPTDNQWPHWLTALLFSLAIGSPGSELLLILWKRSRLSKTIFHASFPEKKLSGLRYTKRSPMSWVIDTDLKKTKTKNLKSRCHTKRRIDGQVSRPSFFWYDDSKKKIAVRNFFFILPSPRLLKKGSRVTWVTRDQMSIA